MRIGGQPVEQAGFLQRHGRLRRVGENVSDRDELLDAGLTRCFHHV